MQSIDYEEIFGSFMGNITDYNIASMNMSDAYSLMVSYLHKALANMYVFKLFTTATLDDDIQIFQYEMEYEINPDVDREFVIMVLGKAMVQAWVTPKVQNIELVAQGMYGKEQRLYSQSAHLSELQALKANIESEVRHLIMDRGFIYNDYLTGEG